MRRYIYIIIGIIVAAAIAIFILFLIKHRSAGPSLTTSSSTTAESLPAVGTQGSNSGGASSTVSTLGLTPITSGIATTSAIGGQVAVQNFGVLSQSPVLDYFVDSQNNITAIQPTGEIISVSNGQTTTVNSSTIDDIISASFSYNGEKILVSYGDPANPQAGIYDSTTNTWTSLPQGMISPQWSPTDNYQIAYLVTTNGGELVLATMNAASPKTTPSVLLALNAEDLTLQWPLQNEFILSDRPTAQSNGSIWVFNSKTGSFNAVLYEAPGGESTWSHSAAFPYGLVFSDAGTGQEQLQLDSLSGTPPPETLSFLTLPSKCAFNPELMPVATSSTIPASSTPYLALYCGIPRSSSGFSSANLPDAYNMMAFFTSDDIYKIDTTTGVEQVLWSDPTQNMDVSDMKFFNNALFFVNRYDQKLYGLTFSSD